jgi:hypothetical protein
MSRSLAAALLLSAPLSPARAVRFVLCTACLELAELNLQVNFFIPSQRPPSGA